MFEGCVTVIYIALVFGISLLGFLDTFHFHSVSGLMLFISVCTWLSAMLVINTPDACNWT
jgi:hypothetical protein